MSFALQPTLNSCCMQKEATKKTSELLFTTPIELARKSLKTRVLILGFKDGTGM
jgi:hypothetical protein